MTKVLKNTAVTGPCFMPPLKRTDKWHGIHSTFCKRELCFQLVFEQHYILLKQNKKQNAKYQRNYNKQYGTRAVKTSNGKLKQCYETETRQTFEIILLTGIVERRENKNPIIAPDKHCSPSTARKLLSPVRHCFGGTEDLSIAKTTYFAKSRLHR